VRRSLLAIAAALAAALVAGPAPASAAVHTKSFDFPVTLDPYEVRQKVDLIRTPEVDGFITKMNVEVVDAVTEKPVPIRRVMLHHVVFASIGQPNPHCEVFRDFGNRKSYLNGARPFFGLGEERNQLTLPPGYGYQIKKEEKFWAMVWMLMNHRGVKDPALIRYTVTWDDSDDITPVHPYWLDVRNCRADPVYDVPGGKAKGSTHTETYDYTMPESGRIVGGWGHVHGGAKHLTVSQPDCGNRRIYRSQPAWGMPEHPFYNVKPVLHEPGPVSMSYFQSQQGYPIRKGERIRLSSRYDAQRLHTRVMGIAGVFVASQPVGKCAAPPTDAVIKQPARERGQPFRTRTPKFTIPLIGYDEDGKAREIERPPGKRVELQSGDTIGVASNFFSKPNVLLDKGSLLRWRFGGSTLHNVTVANGPRGFSSANLDDGRGFKFRFRKPGTYKLFCALHPVGMNETVKVVPKD
jgi:hypothetical protein